MLNLNMGGIAIKKHWIFKGTFLVLVIGFFTLFFNIEVFPDKLNENLKVNTFTPPETRTNDSEVNSLTLSYQKKSPDQDLETQNLSQKVNIENKVTEGFSLFKVFSYPQVPPYILQANYGVNAVSPLKDTTAYLYPDEWETIGDIYIKDGANDIWTRLQIDQLVRKKMWNIQEPPQMMYTPKKKIIWLNNEEFLTIIGYAYGTISTGGACVKVNKITGQAEMIYPAYLKGQEVTDFDLLDGKLILQINVFDLNGKIIDQGRITADLDNLEELKVQEIGSK